MSKGLFARLSRAVLVTTTSLVMVVAGAGLSTAYAAPTKAHPATASSGNSDHSQGNAGTSGTYDQKQPLSNADQNTGGANGQCPDGPYCSTRDGSASGNGNQTTGGHNGEPCAGCVGKADNKNPQGQMPNGSDHNAGYECDRNKGIGQSNPAHTGCKGQTIAAVIDICSTNDQAPGAGSNLAVEGTSITSTNPLAPTAVTAGDHTVDATAPTGYHFVQCAERQSGSSQNITAPGSATEGVNVPASGSGVAYFYVEQDTTTPPPPAPEQHLGAVIYLCGTASTLAPATGSILAIEGTSFSSANPLSLQPVTAGDHTVDATAPTGYHFDNCGPTAQTIVTPGTATEGVDVPAGEDRTAVFFVAQDVTPPTPTQTLAVNVFVCATGQYATGATISTTGAETITDAANPFGPTEVPAGDYTVTATAPSGFTLVDCGHQGSAGPQSVEVPVGGTEVVNFYVAPVQTGPGEEHQTLAGVIYLCSSGHIVSGGTLSATGPQTLTDQANPFGPTDVAAGDYTMTATAPAGFHLVVCNGQGSTATETVTVPENGAGVGTFYVAPDVTPPTVTQTLAGVIYVCSTGMPATGGTLSATGPQTLTDEANPFGPTDVAAGDYTMTATAPAGFHLVVCNGQGSTTTETVTVPEGGSGVGRFFVAPDVTPPTVTQTLAGVILVCSSGQLVPGGSLTATGANGTTTQANPYGPQMVPAGSYSVTATAPSGYHLVVCNGAGSVGAQQVMVPAGGAGVATFFVTKNVPTEVLGEKIPRTPTGSTRGSTPSVAPTVLPFTGSNVTALLPGGLGAVLAGLLLLVAGRRRRTV